MRPFKVDYVLLGFLKKNKKTTNNKLKFFCPIEMSNEREVNLTVIIHSTLCNTPASKRSLFEHSRTIKYLN